MDAEIRDHIFQRKWIKA